MLFYPLYEVVYDLWSLIPVGVWTVILAVLIIMGLFFDSDLAKALAVISVSPAFLYLICYYCKAFEEIPFLGPAGIVIRIVIDASVVYCVINFLKDFWARMAKK